MSTPPRLGLILGIAASVLVLLTVAVVSLVVVGGSGKGSGERFPEARYKLTLPKTLLDGKYHQFAQDKSGTLGKRIEAEGGAGNMRDLKGVFGRYDMGGDQTRGSLIISGMYGRFKDTGALRESMMKGAGEADNTSVVVAPKDYILPGADTTITCEVVAEEPHGPDGAKVESDGTKAVYAVCAWADGNTGAVVGEISPEMVRRKAEDVDVEASARTALKVRQETRQPV